MKSLKQQMAVIISLSLLFPVGGFAAAPTPTPAPVAAPAAQLKALQTAVKAGFLDASKAKTVKKGMTDVEVTDALVALYPAILKIDPKTLKPDESGNDLPAFRDLLTLVGEKKAALRSRNVSAWTLENRLQKIVEALSPEPAPEAEAAPGEEADESPKVQEEKAVVAAVPSEDRKALQKNIDKLSGQLQDVRKDLDSRLKDVEKGRDDDRLKTAAVQDDLSLIRDNLDAMQENLRNLGDRVDEMGKKVGEKGMDVESQKREWTILRKDVRDHSQDLSVLKQKVEKLMAPEKKNASAVDRALSSKWLPGAAILLSVAAVVLSASK